MKKNFSRVITVIISLAIIIGTAATAMAATGTEQIQATLGREIIVTYNGVKQTFTDANGVQVHPIAYQGTTYLPVRATAKMFDNNIQWNGNTNTVAIDESKYTGDNYTEIKEDTKTTNETVSVIMSYDLTVTYKNAVQSFTNANGVQVYPIVNNGTTYLPVRATANMFGEKIEWIGSENRVAIGTEEYVPEVPEIHEASENNDIVSTLKVTGKYASVSNDVSKLSQTAKDLFGFNRFLRFNFDGDKQFLDESNIRVELPVVTSDKFVSFTVVNQSSREIKFEVYRQASAGGLTSLDRIIPSGESVEITLSILHDGYFYFFMATRGGVGDSFQPYDVVVSNFEYHETFEK